MFKGSIVALVTPFTKENKIDLEALTKLINWHIDSKTDGIVICGTTGEGPTVSDEEKLLMLKLAIKQAKDKTKIILNSGTNNTDHSAYLTRKAKEMGADGCLAVVPYYNKPMPLGIIRHFEAIADEGLPVILYYHPGRTSITLSIKTFQELQQIKNIVAIKEASGSLDFYKELMNCINITILSGDDHLTLDMMKLGAKGVISVIANIIPKKWKELTELCLKKDFLEAEKINDQHKSLIKAVFSETNPQGIKYAISLLNGCRSFLRLPLIEPDIKNKTLIQNEMKKSDILPRLKPMGF